jgi:hypothetical protein
MDYKKIFLFLVNLISLLQAREKYYFQSLSTTQQISFFTQNFLEKDLIYGLVGGIVSYAGTKLLKRKFPYLKHNAIKYFYASPFIFFCLRDAFLLKNFNVFGFDILKNKTDSNDIKKKFLSIGFENYIVNEKTINFDSQITWHSYRLFKNKTFLFTGRLFEKLLLFFIAQQEWTRAQEIFSDFLLLDKQRASNVFNPFDTSKKIEILSVLEKLDNLDKLDLEYNVLVEIKDKKKLFNILFEIKDAKLKLKILNTFSVDEISTLYQDRKPEFCSLISSFSITSFENINVLSDIFTKLFSIPEIDELDFLKDCELSQRASLLSCLPIKTIIKLAKTFSEKIKFLQGADAKKYEEIEAKFQSLETFIYEQLPKDKEKNLVSWFSYVRAKDYENNTNPYGAEESPDQKAKDEVLGIEEMIRNELQEMNALRRKNYDRERINFFVYFILSFQHIMTSEENKFLAFSQYKTFKELGSCLIEILIEKYK